MGRSIGKYCYIELGVFVKSVKDASCLTKHSLTDTFGRQAQTCPSRKADARLEGATPEHKLMKAEPEKMGLLARRTG